MNRFETGQTNAVVMAGMCTALAVVLSMIGLYIPVFSGIVFLLIPLPIAYLGMKQGVKWSVVVTGGILILDSVFFGIVSAAFLCAIFGVLGVVMGFCYRYKLSAAKTLLLGAVTVLIALIGEGLAALYILGMPSMLLGGEAMDSMKGAMTEMLPSFYSGDQLTQAESQVDAMVEAMKKSVPFTLCAAALFYSWASMTLGQVIFRRMGITDIPKLPGLERWEFPRALIFVYVAVLLVQHFLADWETAEYIAYNVGSFCIFAFWLQGVATVWWMPRKYPVMRAFRVVIVVLSLFIGLFQMAVVFLGMADMGLNYRKKRDYR